jgi:hypothetical protein
MNPNPRRSDSPNGRPNRISNEVNIPEFRRSTRIGYLLTIEVYVGILDRMIIRLPRPLPAAPARCGKVWGDFPNHTTCSTQVSAYLVPASETKEEREALRRHTPLRRLLAGEALRERCEADQGRPLLARSVGRTTNTKMRRKNRCLSLIILIIPMTGSYDQGIQHKDFNPRQELSTNH